MDNIAVFTSMEMVNWQEAQEKGKGRWKDHELTDQVITKLVFQNSYKTENGILSIKIRWGRKMPVTPEKNYCAMFRYYIEFRDHF